MEMSDNIADLAAALAKAQADLEGAAKKSNNPAFRSKYADLGAVWDAWQEVGPKNGLSVVQFPTDMPDQKMVGMTTMLLHTSGQWMRGVFSLPAGKQDAHGYGSACTYLRRFSLASVVGVCPVDDDGNAAAKVAPRQAPANETAQADAPAQAPNGRAKMTAEQWLDDQNKRLDAMLKAADIDGIHNWPAAEAKALAKLKDTNPEAHAKALRIHANALSAIRAAG